MMNGVTPMVSYRFASFEFDAVTGELRHEGRTLRLEPQPARALGLLLSRAGELVTRDELRAHLWPDDVTVDFDRGLAYCMSQIRSALGEAADTPRFVETLPRRGFRFIGRVEPDAAPVAAPPRARVGTPVILAALFVVALVAWAFGTFGTRIEPAPGQVLAVARFDNETGDPSFDAAVAGLSDAIVGQLVDLPRDEITIAGQNRVLRLPRSERDLLAITRETGATHVVLGQLQRKDDGLVVYAHLLKLPGGSHTWGGTFPVTGTEVAALHSRIADAVNTAVKERLLETGR